MHYMRHVLWEGMSHKRTYLTVGHVLCEGGDHVCREDIWLGIFLQNDISSRGHILLEDMSYGRTCLEEGHVLLEDVILDYCLLWEDVSYWRTSEECHPVLLMRLVSIIPSCYIKKTEQVSSCKRPEAD